jgi:hypothetical protein
MTQTIGKNYSNTLHISDVTPHVLRHSFASIANDLGFTEKFVSRTGEAVSSLGRASVSIEREAAVLSDGGARRSAGSVQQDGKRVAQHSGASGWAQSHATLNASIDCSLQQIGGMKRIEVIDLHAATELDVPVESLLHDSAVDAFPKCLH